MLINRPRTLRMATTSIRATAPRTCNDPGKNRSCSCNGRTDQDTSIAVLQSPLAWLGLKGRQGRRAGARVTRTRLARLGATSAANEARRRRCQSSSGAGCALDFTRSPAGSEAALVVLERMSTEMPPDFANQCRLARAQPPQLALPTMSAPRTRLFRFAEMPSPTSQAADTNQLQCQPSVTAL